MKFGIIIAARTGSRRLPGKALLPLMGTPAINLLIKRLKTSKLADKFVFVTQSYPEDDLLVETVAREGIEIFRGLFHANVLGLYVEAAKKYDFDYCVRVTGDEPFVDGETLDYVLQKCLEIKNFDLVTTKPSFPQGIDYEVYPKKILEQIDKLNPTDEEREHVTYYIYQKEKLNNYNIVRLMPPDNLRLNDRIFLLDTLEDYQNMQKLIEKAENIYTKPSELINIYEDNRKILQ